MITFIKINKNLMQRFLISALIIINLILMGAIVYTAQIVTKTASVAITLGELAKADHARIEALEINLRYYTDPEIIQIRTIDHILRRGEFKDRP